jgi:hypothetical protein
MAEKSSTETTPKDTRTPQQIRDDIARTRLRVTAEVQGLVEEVHPAAVKERVTGEAKAFAQSEIASVKSTVTRGIKDENGELRRDSLVLAGGAVAGVITFLVTVRVILTRLKKKRA